MESNTLIIRGARQHNLKGIDLDLPKNRLIVITGLSGSGKSSLAFDTLYAEGQRRYVESLSTYARQFLGQMEKPDVDFIQGLSPAIAIEQKAASHNPRSTVGTVTEIYDYLRLLYARIGAAHCPGCGQPIAARSLDPFIDQILALEPGTRLMVLAPLAAPFPEGAAKVLKRLKKDGFARVRVNGKPMEIEQVPAGGPEPISAIEVVVDRLVLKEGIRNRLADSLELAMAQSGGRITIDVLGAKPMAFSEKAVCLTCGITCPEFSPASFSFNSPHGACPACDGMGTVNAFDPEKIVPNAHLSLREGAISLWANRNTVHFMEFLDALTAHYDTDIHTPFKDLPKAFQEVLLYGSGQTEIAFYFEKNGRRQTYRKPFEGVIPGLKRRYVETDSNPAREEIRRYMQVSPCPECRGARLNPASCAVTVGRQNIAQVTARTVSEAIAFFQQLSLTEQQALIARRIIQEIQGRLTFLNDVGLSYLTLDRAAYTLSGGEGQRIRLATQIGSKLTGVLYVLDEPSIGLHQRDNQRLLATLMQMRDLGNTVLVVEHDEETIRAADHVVDMGPGAGVHGGHVVFSGPPETIVLAPESLTGQYFSGKRRIAVPKKRRPGNGRVLNIIGACGNNLKQLDVGFPLGTFICVTGVSGSGKSTLVLETLYRALAQRLHHARMPAAPHTELLGLASVDKVVHIDQSPIGKTPRSNPGTYTGIFTHIRDLFARTPDARMRGYKPGRFSFNVKGGRCEACTGDGIIKIEMHFLPDVYVTCDVCKGKRYNRETLEVRYKGRSIAGILDMTVNQALTLFSGIGVIRGKLQTLVDVGLGYIHLGQPATTLSGGEAQRVKLSRELSKKGTGNTVYILDEPTTGLHMDDICRLLTVLDRLVEAGDTVIVIEHNLDVIKSADYLIDLGPEGGDAGGRIVGTGTPEALAAIEASHTGRFLRCRL
jgi:excinuclease ABC subunit A